MRGPALTSATLVLVLVLSSSGAALAQIAPVSRNAANLTVSSSAGTTVISAHLSYRLTSTWDLLVGYDSAAGTSLLSAGGRYYFPSAATVNPYLAIEFLSTGAGATGFLAGVGASLPLVPNLTGFGTAALRSLGGGSEFVYDVGVQYRTAPQFSLVLGASNTFTDGALYIGVSLGLPGR